MGMSNAEKQKAFRARQKAKGLRRGWMAVTDNQLRVTEVASCEVEQLRLRVTELEQENGSLRLRITELEKQIEYLSNPDSIAKVKQLWVTGEVTDNRLWITKSVTDNRLNDLQSARARASELADEGKGVSEIARLLEKEGYRNSKGKAHNKGTIHQWIKESK